MPNVDPKRLKVSKRGLCVRLPGLLVAPLVVGDPLGGPSVDHRPGRRDQALGIDPRAGGLADLFDRQVQAVGRFFL